MRARCYFTLIFALFLDNAFAPHCPRRVISRIWGGFMAKFSRIFVNILA
jgi:hypothetical protein